MKITRKYLNSHRTSFGAYTKLQLAAIDVDWPPKSGWEDSVIGNVISDGAKKEFEKEGARVFEAKRRKAAQLQSMQSKPSKKQKRKLKRRKKHPFYDSVEWRAVRYLILRHYGFSCMSCGESPKKHKIILHVDHIEPRSKRPELELDPLNLQVLCEACNLGKLNRSNDDLRPEDMVAELKIVLAAKAALS